MPVDRKMLAKAVLAGGILLGAAGLGLKFHGGAGIRERPVSLSAGAVSGNRPPAAGVDAGEKAVITGPGPAETDGNPDGGIAESVGYDREIMRDLDRKAAQDLGIREILRREKEFFSEEDRCYRASPRYEEIAAEIRQAALSALAERGIDPRETEKVMEAARQELDLFWNAGGPTVPGACRYAYVARAMLEETAGKTEPSFAVLEALKETITSANPNYFLDGDRNGYALDPLQDVLDRQKRVVESGGHPVDSTAFYAIYDWITVTAMKNGRTRGTESGWQWLLDNAEKGGWKVLVPDLNRGLESTTRNARFGFNPSVYREPVDEKEKFLAIRRLPSFSGSSRQARKAKLNVWEAEGDRARVIRSPR